MDAMMSYKKNNNNYYKKRVIQCDSLCEDTVVVCGFINSEIIKGGGIIYRPHSNDPCKYSESITMKILVSTSFH